jgi:YcaO-like protein with predicted kinase domain
MDTQIPALAKRIGVSRLANITGLDKTGFPVVAAIRPLSRNLSVSFGKGPTVEIAKLSAVMEAAELFYSETPPHVPLKASFGSLQCCSALNPEEYSLFKDSSDLAHEIYDWVQGFSLQSERPMLVPWEMISMDFSCKAREQPRTLRFGATGLAADFDQNRAILHGLCEVVERDSHNTWNNLSHEQRQVTLVDCKTIGEIAIEQLIESINQADLEVLIWDMTGASNIPCYLVEILDPAPNSTTAYVQGAACALSAHSAIMKALTEALQIRLTYIAGSRDDLDWSDYGDRYSTILQNRLWLLKQPLKTRTLPATESNFQTSATAIQEIVRRLNISGPQPVTVIRLSPKDETVAVVKVIVQTLLDTPDANHVTTSQSAGQAVAA